MPSIKRAHTSFQTVLIAGFCSIAASTAAHALMEAGDGAVLLELTGGAVYDSNIFTNDSELDDFLFTISPRLSYQQERGAVHLDAAIGVDVGEFLDYSEQSYQDFSAELSLTGFHRQDSPVNFGLLGGWREETWASEEVGTRVEAEIFEASAMADLALSEKLGLRGSLDYQDSSYENSFYRDSEDFEARLDAVHYYSDKLQLTAGYRYRDISYTGALPDQQTDSFIIGAEGALTAKLSGIVEIGYILQDNGNDDTLIYTLALDWAMDEKTSFNLEGKRDASVSLTGQNAISTSITLNLRQQFTQRVSARVFAGYGEFERVGLDPRDDDFIRIGAGYTQEFNETTSLLADLSYENRDSNSAQSDYERILVSVRLNVLF
jgi:hypothetical protein